MGPVAVKSYPGKRLVKAQPTAETKAERAKQEIDYGRREKAGYVFGALQPKTGEVFTAPYRRRTLVNWIDFLQRLEEWIRHPRGAGLRCLRSSDHASSRRCLALQPGLSTLGVRLPADLRRLPEPD